MVEVEAEMFDRLSAGEVVELCESIGVIEVRQRGHLRSLSSRACFVDALSSAVAFDKGLPEGKPSLRLFIGSTKEN